MTEPMEHGDLRDRLPLLLHDAADAALRDAVESDADLSEELAFLRTAKAALTPAPHPLDTARIAAAIPAYARQRSVRTSPWRIAAAIATIAIGGVSLSIVQQAFRAEAGPQLASVVAESALVADATADGLTITFGQGLSELAADDLETLFAGLSTFDGLPSVEPARAVNVPPTTEGGAN